MAISDCVTASIPHARLRNILKGHAHLGRPLWLEMAVDGAIQREWFHRLARQDALRRIAHLLCEIDARLEIVGLADDGRFSLSLTQEQFADRVGLTTVHVNRTLKELRRRRLAIWSDGRVQILDRPGMRRLADFDDAYLRLFAAEV